MPKVSVIIPVYNTEKHLRQCLDSVINQTLTDIEIICIDDCSSDNSLSILKEYSQKDKRIVVIELKENLKQGGARNRGLDIAKGEYIMFVDSDDYIEAEMLEKYYNAFIKNDCDIVISGYINIKEDESIDKIYDSQVRYSNKTKKEQGLYKIDNNISTFNTGPVAKLFKKSIIDKYNIRFPEKLIQEDEAFHWMYFSVIKNAYCLSKNYYIRLVHKNGTMSIRENCGDGSFDIIKIHEHIYSFLIKHKLFNKVKKNYSKTFDRHLTEVLRRCKTKEEKKHYAKIIEKMETKIFYSPFEKIFSIKNSKDKKHKILTIFGVKLKFKRRRNA